MTTRTANNTFQYQNLTAADIAHSSGFEYLYDPLTPVIKHFVPPILLLDLQTRLHDFIRTELQAYVLCDHLYLPELLVLMEMEVPQLWFRLRLATVPIKVSDIPILVLKVLTASGVSAAA